MARRVIFVSCGQDTPAEKELGREIKTRIERASREMRAFFAEEVHSPSDLNAEIFRQIQKCAGFFAVMHKRGTIAYRSYPPAHRSSVWIQQEIGIFCYRMFLQGRYVPVRVYLEKDVRREGLMNFTIVNPIEFESEGEVLQGLDQWLVSREFDEDPMTARREGLFRRRASTLTDEDWLYLELLAAHSIAPGNAVNSSHVADDFYAVLRAKMLADPQIQHLHDNAQGKLSSLGLISVLPDRTSGLRILRLETQWWDLVMDELRSEGRISSSS